MGKYNCDKCGKEFNQKSHYTTHMNKKNPCVIDSKIKEMIDNAVKEKLIEIGKATPLAECLPKAITNEKKEETNMDLLEECMKVYSIQELSVKNEALIKRIEQLENK